MDDLYIYYKVPQQHAAALWPRVQAMQAQLASDTGVTGQLRRRPQASAGVQTWMEIYLAAPPDFARRLEDAVLRAAFDNAIDGARHVELFTDTSPCA